MQFVLASESARRVDLLRMVGYDFVGRKSGFPEVSLSDPAETAVQNARGKALAVAEGPGASAGTVVLAADTVVYVPGSGEVLGQAKSEGDVRRMLGLLEGREHEVYSGVAVVGGDGDGVSVESVRTRVRMRGLSEPELLAYARLGEGVGKAGGYAIQGTAALFVEGIEGDYTNVVGLPLSTTSRMLEEHGVRWY
ncbi:septum formation protein Maf [Rubrobacter marinus]|uniref:dTTP/UTP pyrophosphatase n=1 Tax=Rubrobacter marinus TaxID=2653852 RepID=A0A6G8PX36_9ACTN|nr:Maf family protein [Rubrobacter marinus]QIN78789.1 septum formation protein Maf [Rubrobacter marinus]